MTDPLDEVWKSAPRGTVVGLAGPRAQDVFDANEPFEPKSPHVLVYVPQVAASTREAVQGLLDALADWLVLLFPSWPPGADRLAGAAATANRAALRSVARDAALAQGISPSFLEEIATRALSGVSLRGAAALETEASQLPRVLTLAYGASEVVWVVQAPDDPAGDSALAEALGWFAHLSELRVLCCYAPPRPALSRIPVLLTAPARTSAGVPARSVVAPPVSGRPHPHSGTERRFAEALARHPWAAGVTFNGSLRLGQYQKGIRADALWPDIRAIVELDGPDHREEPKFGEDRRRDTELQLAGYMVMRVTNEQFARDPDMVLRLVERLVTEARLRAEQRSLHAR